MLLHPFLKTLLVKAKAKQTTFFLFKKFDIKKIMPPCRVRIMRLLKSLLMPSSSSRRHFKQWSNMYVKCAMFILTFSAALVFQVFLRKKLWVPILSLYQEESCQPGEKWLQLKKVTEKEARRKIYLPLLLTLRWPFFASKALRLYSTRPVLLAFHAKLLLTSILPKYFLDKRNFLRSQKSMELLFCQA